MYRGNDELSQAGCRFKRFVDDFYIDPAREKSAGEMIYAFRNALHHSYRLPTEWGPQRNKAKRRFRLVDTENRQWVSHDNNDETVINLFRLHQTCECALVKFYSWAVSPGRTHEEKENFSNMFHRYGWLVVEDNAN